MCKAMNSLFWCNTWRVWRDNSADDKKTKNQLSGNAKMPFLMKNIISDNIPVMVWPLRKLMCLREMVDKLKNDIRVTCIHL